jgi:hypothetical protein
VDGLQTSRDAGFEDACDGLAGCPDRGLFFEQRDERVRRVARDQEAVVVCEGGAQGRQAVGYGFGGVGFVVDAGGSGRRGEVCVRGLAELVVEEGV